MHDLLKPTGRGGPLTTIGLTVFGFVLALAPAMLWIAWTPFVFGVVVAAIAGSAAMFIVLHERDAPAAGEQRVAPEYRRNAAVQDALIEEIHGAFPLTYHHSNRGRARFRRAMEKVRELIK